MEGKEKASLSRASMGGAWQPVGDSPSDAEAEVCRRGAPRAPAAGDDGASCYIPPRLPAAGHPLSRGGKSGQSPGE